MSGSCYQTCISRLMCETHLQCSGLVQLEAGLLLNYMQQKVDKDCHLKLGTQCTGLKQIEVTVKGPIRSRVKPGAQCKRPGLVQGKQCHNQHISWRPRHTRFVGSQKIRPVLLAPGVQRKVSCVNRLEVIFSGTCIYWNLYIGLFNKSVINRFRDLFVFTLTWLKAPRRRTLSHSKCEPTIEDT